MYPICPKGSVATRFVEFCIIVAPVSVLSLKLNFVQKLVEKKCVELYERIGFVV